MKWFNWLEEAGVFYIEKGVDETFNEFVENKGGILHEYNRCCFVANRTQIRSKGEIYIKYPSSINILLNY